MTTKDIANLDELLLSLLKQRPEILATLTKDIYKEDLAHIKIIFNKPRQSSYDYIYLSDDEYAKMSLFFSKYHDKKFYLVGKTFMDESEFYDNMSFNHEQVMIILRDVLQSTYSDSTIFSCNHFELKFKEIGKHYPNVFPMDKSNYDKLRILSRIVGSDHENSDITTVAH